MRVEATIEEWGKLYELAVQYKKMKPWEEFWSSDVVAVRLPEDTAYFSIMGKMGDCVGLSLYLGDEGFNDFLGVSSNEYLDIEPDYIMLEQNCITMYMGAREEVSKEQYAIIRELGIKFRGKGNWIYFDTYEKGFVPYLPDQREVQIYIKYLEKLLDALKYCSKFGCSADFDEGEIFLYSCENGEWTGKAIEPPSEGYCYEGLIMSDDIMAAKLKKAIKKKKSSARLEIDMFYLRSGVADEEFEKPFIPKVAVIAEHASGMVLDQRLLNPSDDDVSCLTQMLAAWILDNGAPREVMVRNRVIKALVEDLCEKCQIKLSISELEIINDCKSGLLDYMNGDMDEDDMYDFSPEDGQMMFELLEEAGIDVDELREKAMSMSEEEFSAEMMGQMMKFVEQMGLGDIEDE